MSTAVNELLDGFFRHGYGKLVSVLTRLFGPRHHELAEDVVQAALVKAMESWRFGNVPQNPSAWLYRVARNRALDVLRREGTGERLAADIIHHYDGGQSAADLLDSVFLEDEISDSQLRMMFVCCDPDMPAESRIALTLKTLCGFSSTEIADALLTSQINVNKRLQRARQYLRELDNLLDLPTADRLKPRLESVHAVLYLLFNEGYHSSHSSEVIRQNLCDEAIRLCRLLAEHPVCRAASTWALLALMLFHSARFAARLDADGDIVLLEDQDRGRWDRKLIGDAGRCLERSAEGNEISTYQLEAAIAAHHCMADSIQDTDWSAILHLYDMLLELKPSPIYQLNRTIVLAKIRGPAAGINEIERIRDAKALSRYYLLEATLGQLQLEAGQPQIARELFQDARKKTTSEKERSLLDRKIAAL